MGTGLSSADASQAILARRLISLTDLTSLNESDDAASVRALSLLARSSPVQPAATPDAAAVLFDVIAAAGRHDRSIGFKASGGIRTIGDATVYLRLYEQRFGSGSASPGNFRIGASALFKELLAAAA